MDIKEELGNNMINLKQFSDDQILNEYNLRFRSIGEYRQKMSSSAMVKAYLSNILDDKEKDREHFFCIFLDGQNSVISIDTLFTGSLTTSAVYPREVIKAILKHEAANVILAHNHPSGSLQPSGSDRAVTKKLQAACSSIDVGILDHIIIGDGYFSFADHNLI
jgi:DNA repair protein RadC